METMLSIRGKKLIIIDKYTFRKHKDTVVGVTYRCTKGNCTASICVDKSEQVLLQTNCRHNHPCSENLHVKKLQNELKKEARIHISQRPSKIINMGIKKQGDDAMKISTKDVENIRKSIYRSRRSVREDFYPHEILQKTPDPTPSHHNDELEPNMDLETEISSKRKREEEFELTLSDSRESDAQPSSSQTFEEIDRPLISAESYISYKQKYKELLDSYKILEQQLFHLKNNTDKNKKSGGTFKVIPSSSTVVKRTKFDHVQIRHSQEEIEELGKQWTDEFSHLSADQQVYAKEAISDIFNAAKMNNLHSKSVSVKTDHSEVDIFDEHLTSTGKGFSTTSVKNEDSGKEIYDDPSTPVNVELSVSVKSEESELDFDFISVKTEETHDVYDENDYRYNQYKIVNFIPDNIDVSVKPEEAELYEENCDMSDNRCLLRTNEDCSVSNLISNEIEIYDDHEVDVIKIEKDEII